MCAAYADAASYADALIAPGRRDDEGAHHRDGAPPDGGAGAPWPGAAPAAWATGPEPAPHPAHGTWPGVGGGSGAGGPAERAETTDCGLAMSGCGLAAGPRQSAAAPPARRPAPRGRPAPRPHISGPPARHPRAGHPADPGAARRSLDECLELAGALRDRRLEDYARRVLRALRAGPPRGRTDAPTARWARPSGVEVRPGVWRLRTPALC
ncbi:hypothetical protein AB0F42_18105 [Streptomyces buecherae]|uniref:hypothetical protein n=1 Tax=Streptomyces buecherae TaxID=2763006 RepID=UPI0033CD9FC2